MIFFFVVGLGVVIGAELNAALAETGATALKGEVYTGPYTDQLEVEEPQPGEDVQPVHWKEGSPGFDGIDERQARLDHGPRQRSIARLGHRPAPWAAPGAELAFSYQGEALEKACGRSPNELG